GGLRAQLLLRLGDRAQVRGEAALGLAPTLLDQLELAVHPRERLGDRLDDLLHRPLALLQLLAGGDVMLAQLALRKLEEGLLRLAQHAGGNGLEALVPFYARAHEEPDDDSTD